jgi:aldehyde:ferredoxin oxidoreductase
VLFGWHGRYLRIDPRPGRTAFIALDERILHEFVGGVGLGTWIVAHETPAGADPLGTESALVFALSPLVGSPLTTSAKFAVVALSPLTGRLCDALASSHFAIAAKRAGIDALAITGVCDEPTVVLVDGHGTGDGTAADAPRVAWRPAGSLWGLPARAA